MGQYVSYLRVSTDRQGKSGLGLEAQREAVAGFLRARDAGLIAEFVEVESGKRDSRPKLAAALKACRTHGVPLLIAKLDRLSRDAHFLLGLQKSGVEFIAVDMPHANRLTIGIMALVAQEEREMISARTKAALAAAKARGVKLGGDRGNIHEIGEKGRQAGRAARSAAALQRAYDLGAIVAHMREQGINTLGGIAAGLNASVIRTPRGGQWTATQVKRLLTQVEASEAAQA